MIMTEPYTGAYFTMYYNDMKSRCGIDFEKAFTDLNTAGLLTVGTHKAFFAQKERICKRAELEYGFREIGSETPDGWLINCRKYLIELADKYEAVLEREGASDFDASMISDGKTVSEYGSVIKNRFQDTPYEELDGDSDYTTSQSFAERGGQDVLTTQTGTDAENLMRLRAKWESTINVIVKDLGDLFMHTVGYEAVL